MPGQITAEAQERIELPYVTDPGELAYATVGMSQELLWRLVGYDQRVITQEDIDFVIAGLDVAKAEFVRRAEVMRQPKKAASAGRTHLRIVGPAAVLSCALAAKLLLAATAVTTAAA